MPPGVLPVLAALLEARDPADRDAAWERFAADNSRLILHAIRRMGRSHDTVMDRIQASRSVAPARHHSAPSCEPRVRAFL
jgi:hypothetical protein